MVVNGDIVTLFFEKEKINMKRILITYPVISTLALICLLLGLLTSFYGDAMYDLLAFHSKPVYGWQYVSAVSYTHLDVYKRQDQWSLKKTATDLEQSLLAKESDVFLVRGDMVISIKSSDVQVGDVLVAVSYTHLPEPFKYPADRNIRPVNKNDIHIGEIMNKTTFMAKPCLLYTSRCV